MSDTIEMHDNPRAAAPVLNGLLPYIQVDGAVKAGEFYQRAFGAVEAERMPVDEQGRTMHLHLHVNGSSLMLCDPYPEYDHPLERPQGFTLQLILKDSEIDAWWVRAVEAGAEVVTPLERMFWGDRYGQLRDPFGVLWAMDAPAENS